MKLPRVITKILVTSDIHHCITYMYINVQQYLVSRLIKAVHTNLFAKYRMLHVHKFATINNNYEKIEYFRHASLHTCISIFSKIGLLDWSKKIHTIIFAKNIAS